MLLWRSKQHLCDVIDSGSSVADVICLLSNAKQRDALSLLAAAAVALLLWKWIRHCFHPHTIFLILFIHKHTHTQRQYVNRVHFINSSFQLDLVLCRVRESQFHLLRSKVKQTLYKRQQMYNVVVLSNSHYRSPVYIWFIHRHIYEWNVFHVIC